VSAFHKRLDDEETLTLTTFTAHANNYNLFLFPLQARIAAPPSSRQNRQDPPPARRLCRHLPDAGRMLPFASRPSPETQNNSITILTDTRGHPRTLRRRRPSHYATHQGLVNSSDPLKIQPFVAHIPNDRTHSIIYLSLVQYYSSSSLHMRSQSLANVSDLSLLLYRCLVILYKCNSCFVIVKLSHYFCLRNGWLSWFWRNSRYKIEQILFSHWLLN
jgi:hypothetical protein